LLEHQLSTKTISFCCHILLTRRRIKKSCSFATPIESEEAHAKLVARHDASHGAKRKEMRQAVNICSSTSASTEAEDEQQQQQQQQQRRLRRIIHCAQ